ncbi:MAG: Uma2 family endonuclease [Myxococcota bacterium]
MADGTSAQRTATYDDVLAAPPHMIAEVIDGELRLQPRPAKPHAAASSALGEELGPPFKRGRGGPGGWILLNKPELHLDADILVPDIAGWRRERMPAILADEPFFTLAPDWVAEILSPSTGQHDRTDKLQIYHREGIAWVWLVDPLQRTLEVRHRSNSAWTLRGTWRDEQRPRAEPFDAIELELGILWADVVLPPDRR